MITLEFHDELEYHKGGMESLLSRKVVLPDGTEIDYVAPSNEAEHLQKIKEGVQTERKCRLYGKLDLPKVGIWLQ